MIIYQAVNQVNGKFYIGMTKFSLKHRKYKHLQGVRGNSKSYFHRSIRKYGPENFKWEVIDSSAKTVEELKQLEIDYIAKLNPKYNMTAGGDGTSGYKITEEHRRKLSESHKGNKHSEETKKKMSETWKVRSKDSELLKKRSMSLKGKNKNKVRSQDLRDRISKSLKGSIPWNKGKKCSKHSEETKEKMRISQRKRWSKRKNEKLSSSN